MKNSRIGYAVLFLATLVFSPQVLRGQTAGSAATYEAYVEDHVKAKSFTVTHDPKLKLTKIKREMKLDPDMLLKYSPDNVGDNNFKVNLDVFALVPDHPTLKNPPLAFLIFWDSTDGTPRYADCSSMAVTIDGKDLGEFGTDYQKKDGAAGSTNEFVTATLNGSQFLGMGTADQVQVEVCTDQFILTQEQKWTLRWIGERFLEVLKQKMK